MPQDLQGAADLLNQLIPSAKEPDTNQTFDEAHEARIDQAIAEDAAESETPDAAAVATSESEKPAPTASELRVKEMQERVAALQEKRKNDVRKRELEESNRRAAQREKDLEAREAAAKKAEEFAREQERAWKDSLKDPIGAYKRIGVNPSEAYDALSTAAERANTPEAKEEALRERLKAEIAKEYESKFAKVSEMEARLAEFEKLQSGENHSRAEYAKRQAESEFIAAATQNGNEVLADYYEPEELVQLGHSLANEFIAAQQPFTVKDIADELRTRLEAQLKRAEEKRNRRTQTPQASAPQTGAKKPGAAPADVINASTASSVASSVPKRLTPEQRRADAARMLSSMGL